jgi:hypothetical protein
MVLLAQVRGCPLLSLGPRWGFFLGGASSAGAPAPRQPAFAPLRVRTFFNRDLVPCEKPPNGGAAAADSRPVNGGDNLVQSQIRMLGDQWRCAHRQLPLVAADRGTIRQCQIGLSFRRAGIGRQVHSCRNSLAALYSAAVGRASAFLAIRRLGHSGGTLRYCGGLSQVMEPWICKREPHW